MLGVKMMRPLGFRLDVVISQEFGNDNPREPFGWKPSENEVQYSIPHRGAPGHWHNGVDYALACSSPLVAPCDGRVLAAGLSPSGFGLRLLVDAGPVWWLLGHLSTIGVKAGENVRMGQFVAHSGGGMGDWRDGNSTGCHLHWSVMRNNLDYLGPAQFLQ